MGGATREKTVLSLLKHEVVSRRHAILWWGLGLILFGVTYIAAYPSMAGGLAAMELEDIAIYEAMGVQMSTFEGYLSSAVVQYLAIILIVYAIIAGTGTLAGEEDSGSLELLLATPIPRAQIVTAKALALAVVMLLILLIAAAGNAATLAAVEIATEVTPLDLFWAILSAWPLVMAFAMMSLFLGALLPTRRAAAMVATVVFIIAYFGKGLSGMVEALEPLQPLSLFYYFESTAALFTEGVQSGDMLVLLAVALLFFLLSVLSFQRRNVTTGAWPWAGLSRSANSSR